MLTEKQNKAVTLLYEGETVQDTAQALGVHRSTIWRWSKTRDFRREIKRLERNRTRRLERKRAKWDYEFEKRLDKCMNEAEEKLYETIGKSGENPGKRGDKAWNEYKNTLFQGMTLEQLYNYVTTGKIKRRKGRRKF